MPELLDGRSRAENVNCSAFPLGLDRTNIGSVGRDAAKKRDGIDGRRSHADRCEHKGISITKLVDLSSPVLMPICSAGWTVIAKAKLEFMRANGDGKPAKYYEVDIVSIGNMDQVAHEGADADHRIYAAQVREGATAAQRR